MVNSGGGGDLPKSLRYRKNTEKMHQLLFSYCYYPLPATKILRTSLEHTAYGGGIYYEAPGGGGGCLPLIPFIEKKALKKNNKK